MVGCKGLVLAHIMIIITKIIVITVIMIYKFK